MSRRWVDENGLPTVAGAEAMFDAFDRVRERQCRSRWNAYECERPFGHTGDHATAGNFTVWSDASDTRETVVMTHSAAYELGRARGYITGRAEPDSSDWEYLHRALPESEDGEDGDVEATLDEYMTGMLDGRDQAATRRLGLPCPEPPSPEALAAAREGTS